MKSIEQAHDLAAIMKASGAKWSHVFSVQYKARLSSLYGAENRQIERFNYGNPWERIDAEKKLKKIEDARNELTELNEKLFDDFKKSKQNEAKIKN